MRRHAIANRRQRVRLRREEVVRLLDHLLDIVGEPRGASVVLVGDRTIRRLNRTWMGEDKTTDVLSFPMGDPPPGPAPDDIPLGEIAVCVPVCERAAAARGRPLHDEIARMIVHGALHLAGHDHATRRQAARMRPIERRAMRWARRTGIRVVSP